MFLIDIIITCFIEYEFKLNWMNVYVWYDVISIFVKDMKWWSRYNIFRKGDTSVEIVECVLFVDLINKDVS